LKVKLNTDVRIRMSQIKFGSSEQPSKDFKVKLNTDVRIRMTQECMLVELSQKVYEL
jgi:hypothetical protein